MINSELTLPGLNTRAHTTKMQVLPGMHSISFRLNILQQRFVLASKNLLYMHVLQFCVIYFVCFMPSLQRAIEQLLSSMVE